jgi:hypothetical protein
MDRYEGPAKIFVNGRLQAKASSTRVREISNNQKVHTMHKGLAGFSDGPHEVEIMIEGAIPKAGFETDFATACKDKAFIKISTSVGGQRNNYTGKIADFETSQAVNQMATYTVNFEGKRQGSTVLASIGRAIGL